MRAVCFSISNTTESYCELHVDLSMRRLTLLRILAAALIVAALVGGLAITRMLQRGDQALKSRMLAGFRANTETLVQRVVVPSPGTIRTVICPADGAASLTADTSEIVLRDRSGRELKRATLSPDPSRHNRCLDAITHATGDLQIFLRPSVSNGPRVRGVEVFSHRSITPWLSWPVLAWLAGFSLLLYTSKPPSGEAPSSNEASLEPIVANEKSTEHSEGDDTAIPVRWPFGWLFAIGAYVFVHIATVLVMLLVMLVRKAEPGAFDGLSLGLSTIIQHGMLIGVSLVLLGAWSKRAPGTNPHWNWYSAAGFKPFTKKGVGLSVLAALLLVGIAVGCTTLIPDLNSSPMGVMLERSPARYAIAFGALIAPLSEELYFRGVLVSAFGRKNIWFGVLGSVLFFTAAHVMQLWGSWAGLIPICAVGITNAIIRAKSKGLEQPWLIHTLYNGILTVSLYFTG